MPAQSLGQIRTVLERLVLRSGQTLRRRLESARQIHYKSEKDLVTEMDREVEAYFVRTLRRQFPDHAILSEEASSAQGNWEAAKKVRGFRWIIDPVDGTTNYAHRLPHFAVSAGVEKNGRMVLGAVYNPMLREFFFGARGKGAWLNGKKITVSATPRLEQALLGTGFPYDIRVSRQNNFAEFSLMSMASQAVRRPGAASLDICYVACGRFDGFWEYQLKPWDVAAASLIVEEAGGRITTNGRPGVDLFGSLFVVSNGRIHEAINRVLRQARGCRGFRDLRQCLASPRPPISRAKERSNRAN